MWSLGWKAACGTCRLCARGEPRQCKKPPAAPGRLHRHDGADAHAGAPNRHVRDAHGRPGSRAVRVPRRAPGRAGVPDRLRRRDRRHVRAGDGEGLGGRACRGDRLRRGRAVGRSRARASPVRPRSARSTSTSGSCERARAFGATHTEPGPVDFAFDVVGLRATFEQALGLIASGGTVVLIGLSPAGETRDARPAGAVRRGARASWSPTAATTCRRRTSRGSRSGRSTARSTSLRW